MIFLIESREIQVGNVDSSRKIYLRQSCSVITSLKFQFLRDELTKLKGISHKFALMKETGQCFCSLLLNKPVTRTELIKKLCN